MNARSVLLLGVIALFAFGPTVGWAIPVQLPVAGPLADPSPSEGSPSQFVPAAGTAAYSFEAIPESSRSADDDQEPFGVSFSCPLQTGEPESQVVVDSTVCPAYLIDIHDLMGQPVLTVDPANPRIMAFHALHGGRGLHNPLGPQPPTEHSRHNLLHQPHTTWQSRDGGGNWTDNRYWAPESLALEGREVFGEDNAIVLDDQGRIYLAALYSHRGADETQHQWSVALWKASRGNRNVDYYDNVKVIDADKPENWISDLWIAYSREANRVVVYWLEHSNATAGGPTSWVEAYFTQPGEGARWTRLPQVQRVGPCREISNPVSWNGQVFFGCMPDEGYSYGNPGRWHIHRIDPAAQMTSYAGPTPVGETHARLVDFAGTGHMLLIGSGIDSDGRPHVTVSKGAAGLNWTDPDEFGEDIQLGTDQTLEDARITAAAYTKKTGNIHVIYQENYETAPPTDQIGKGQARGFGKNYAVLRWQGDGVGWVGKFQEQLHYGNPPSALVSGGPLWSGLSDDIYEDLHDDIITIWDPHEKKERIFTVFGDYGSVRFAEVVELRAALAFPLPPANVPAVPLLAEATTASSSGAVAGALTGLMLLRLLLAKKKSTVKAPSI